MTVKDLRDWLDAYEDDLRVVFTPARMSSGGFPEWEDATVSRVYIEDDNGESKPGPELLITLSRERD